MSAAPATVRGQEPAFVADVLSTLAAELERIRVLGLRVEQTICAIAVRSSIDNDLVSELQHLDAVLQQVAALRDFSEQLSLQCDDRARVDIAPALSRITLADIRSRLARESEPENEEGWEIL